MHYLDATSAVRPRDNAITGLGRAMSQFWADPHRDHHDGRRAREALDAAKQVIANAVGARPRDVIATSSLTQAAHLAVQGILNARRHKFGSEVLVSAMSRTSILHAIEHSGTPVSVEALSSGVVDTEVFIEQIDNRPTVALVALEAVNVETGTIQPVQPVIDAARKKNIPVLLDASVALTRTAIPTGWDALVLDAGEWGCGFGLGFVVASSRLRLRPTWPQDQDAWFPGGISPSWAFTAAVALEDALKLASHEQRQLRDLTQHIRDELAKRDYVTVLGNDAPHVSHIVSVAVHGCDGQALARELERYGYSVGTGSACTSSTIEPNHVLRAMGIEFDGHLRMTLDYRATHDDVVGLALALDQAYNAIIS